MIERVFYSTELWAKSCSWLAFIIVCVLSIVLVVQRPKNDWDMLAYTACVFKVETNDSAVVHNRSYSLVKSSVAEDEYEQLVNGDRYRSQVAQAVEAFQAQLPFYCGRVGYVMPMYWLNRSGLSPLSAGRVLGMFSFLLLALCVYLWMLRITAPWPAWLLSCLLLISSGAFMTARLFTPDMLTAALLVVALYSGLELRRFTWTVFLLGLAVLVRVDSILFSLPLIFYWSVFSERFRKVAWPTTIVLLVMASILRNCFPAYGWWTTIFHTFCNYLPRPDLFSGSFNAGEYLKIVSDGFIYAANARVGIFIFIGVVLCIAPAKLANNKTAGLALLVLFSMVLRFAVFPLLWERFFVAHFILLAMLLIDQLLRPELREVRSKLC
jgi:hypothetical protein